MKLLLAFAFAVSSFSINAAVKSDLTPVVKDVCLLLPALKPFANMTSGVEYTIKMDYSVGCNEDMHGNQYDCDTHVGLNLKYRYQRIKTVEYYTREGRLVSTAKEKESLFLNRGVSELVKGEYDYDREFNYSPRDALAKQQIDKLWSDLKGIVERQIKNVLYESGDSACADSHYQ